MQAHIHSWLSSSNRFQDILHLHADHIVLHFFLFLLYVYPFLFIHIFLLHFCCFYLVLFVCNSFTLTLVLDVLTSSRSIYDVLVKFQPITSSSFNSKLGFRFRFKAVTTLKLQKNTQFVITCS